MRCLFGCVLMIIPRLALLFVMLAQPQLVRYAFESLIWPWVGFFFMPITTLAYIWAMHASGKHITGFYLAIVVMGVLLDLMLLTGAGKGSNTYRSMPQHD